MSRAENAYIGRANITRRYLRIDGQPLSLEDRQAVTKVQFRLGPHCVDSTVVEDPINYYVEDGTVDIRIGLIPDIEEGTLTGKLIVYDAATPEGKAWGAFDVVVMPWAACDE